MSVGHAPYHRDRLHCWWASWEAWRRTVWHPERHPCQQHRCEDDECTDTDMPFGGKFDTMIALGEIGPTAGPRAAAIIRQTIYDSQPWVIAARDRVRERLETAEEAWTICSECCYGRVHDLKGHGASACSVCLGIGYRGIEQAQAAGRFLRLFAV